MEKLVFKIVGRCSFRKELMQIARFAVETTLTKHLTKYRCKRFHIELTLLSDSEMQKLNLKYRQKNKSTDVLSFPLWQKLPDGTVYIGDLFISPRYVKAQAKEYGVALLSEYKFLVVHGILHLFGYDHEKVPAKIAAKMRRLESKILALSLK